MRESSYNLKLHSHTPKRFRGGERKVMKKSLSLVVALAMVFSLLVPAMAFAATAQEEAAGNTLKELGVLKGNEQGDLMLDKELTRQEMIILLSRLLGVEDEAKNHPNTHGWPDVANSDFDGYISWAKENGLTKGVEDGSVFGYDQALTVEQLLQFLLRALGYTDVAWDDVASTAVELGLIAAGTDVKAVAKRGTMAVVTLTTLDTNVNGENVTLGAKLGLPGYEIDEVAIASFAAVGAKKLQLTFAGAVDSKNAKISVKRGTSTVTISDSKWSDDKASVILETASKLIEGTYTVTVEGVADEALTATLTAENEKVASIEITSDVAPIARATNSGDDIPDQVVVNYVVKNQYGEDVSNLYVPQVTTSVGNQNDIGNGVLKITKPGGNFNINEQFVVTLTYVNGLNMASVSKTLSVGVSAKVSDVSIVELYNKDADAVLSEDTDPSAVGNFKLILEAKDQYGNVVKDLKLLEKDLIISVGGTHVISLAGYDPSKYTATIEEVEIDGAKKTALSLANLNSKGSAIVNAVAKFTGRGNPFTVVVEEGLTYDVVTLGSVAGIVAVGEEALVPVTVIDSKGNSITDTKKLNSALSAKNGIGVDKLKVNVTSPDSTKPASEEKFVLKDGTLYYSFKANAQGIHTVTAFTETYKNDFTTVDVKAAATPKVIVGLKSDTNKAIFINSDLKLNKDNILVEDNYGRLMSPAALNNSLGANAQIELVLATNSNAVEVDVTSDVYLAKDDEIVLKGANKGQHAVTLQLIDPSKPSTDKDRVIAGSQYSTTLRTVELSEIKSIEVADVGTMYAADLGNNTAYDKTVKVTGVTSDGAKVELPNTVYSVTTANPNLVANGNTLHVPSKNVISSGSEAKVVIRVVTDNGLSAEQEVTLTNVAPKVDSIKIGNGDAEQTIAITGTNVTVDLTALNLEVKDQYGVKIVYDSVNNKYEFANGDPVPSISVTFSDLGNLTASSNGTEAAAVTLQDGQSVTVTVKIGTVTATAKFTAVK